MQQPGVSVSALKASRDYDRALRRALWRRLRRWLRHQCNELLSTDRVLEQVEVQDQHDLGLQEIPLDRIVGSSGRAHDFDLGFLPRRREMNGRWERIALARYEGIDLPPPLLLKIGDAYFVQDGNHRVSVAQAAGEDTIDALVTTVDDSNLIADPSCSRLGFKLEGRSAAMGVPSLQDELTANCR